MARDGRGGLGLGDRLILLLAWITTCGLVYLLGFYVGKGTQAQSLRVEQQVVRLPVTSAPPPEGQRPKTEPEFGFYDKLMGEQGAERAPDKVHEEAKPVQPAAHVLPPGRGSGARAGVEAFAAGPGTGSRRGQGAAAAVPRDRGRPREDFRAEAAGSGPRRFIRAAARPRRGACAPRAAPRRELAPRGARGGRLHGARQPH